MSELQTPSEFRQSTYSSKIVVRLLSNRPQHRTPHYGPRVAHAAAARPSAVPPRKQLRWNTPGRGRSAPESSHILWDQPDQEVSDTKINSPDGVDRSWKGLMMMTSDLHSSSKNRLTAKKDLKPLSTTKKMTPYLR